MSTPRGTVGAGGAQPRTPHAALALGLAFVSGAAIALQAYLNGRLAGSLGSTELAAAVSFAIGFAILLCLGVGSGALRRAARRVRTAGPPRWWHFLGGVAGALLVFVAAKGAPEVGVALLTVAIVCGQTTGGLAADASGLSPAGRRPITAARVGGVGLAIGAVVIAAAGAKGDLEVGLLALAVLAGAGIALQQAANGQLTAHSGEFIAAGVTNFFVGGAILAVVAFAATGWSAPDGWDAPVAQWLGGPLGVVAVLIAAWAVASLGVLRLTLAVVSGQSAGALAIDLVAPAAGEVVSIVTVLGVGLTLSAVWVSGRSKRAVSTSGTSRATNP